MRARQPGFTLTEILVALVVSSIVAAGALGLLVAHQRAYRDSADDRAIQDTARIALSELSTNLRRAGYGIEPWLAFDFGAVTNAPPSWVGGPSLATKGYPGGTPGGPPNCSTTTDWTTRDQTTASDEIVFHARDPAFQRPLSAAPTSSSLTLNGALTTPMYQGQILQVMCAGASAWAYVTVASTVLPDASQPTPQIPLTTGCTGFPYQQDMLGANPCFSIGWATARVFRIDRFHYYVDRFPDAAIGGTRPYLMLDRGLWDGNAALVEPVAPDVEDLQFAYLFPRAPTTARQLVGATPGLALARSTSSIDLAAVPPAYVDVTAAASRTTNHPANIRGVRMSAVVRQAFPNPKWLGDATYRTIPAAQNREALNDSAVPGGYRRVLVESTEAIRNLDARAPYFPAFSTSSPLGADGLNVNGG